MTTTVTKVVAGTTTVPIAVNSGQSVFLGPQVGGGTVLLQWSPTQSGPFYAAGPGSSVQGYSFRLPNNLTFGWIQATATTQAATLAISDIGQTSVSAFPMSELVSICSPMSSDNAATAEQIIFSMRIPPFTLPRNFNIQFKGSADFSNNANAKTLQMRINGVGGTLFYQSTALASVLNLSFMGSCGGQADGVSWIGLGSGLTSIGGGLSSTAFTTLTRDYLGQETELVVTATKATAADLFVLEQLSVSLF